MLSDLRNKHYIQKIVIVYYKSLSKLVEKYLDNDKFFVASIQIHIKLLYGEHCTCKDCTFLQQQTLD